MKNYYFTPEELELLSEEQINALDAEYWYEKWLLEQEAMETDYQKI